MKNADKIALTMSQLRKMMDESYDDKWAEYSQEESIVINALDKIWNQLDKLRDSTKFGSKNFERDVQIALDSINKAKRSYMV